jgi:serine protease Do
VSTPRYLAPLLGGAVGLALGFGGLLWINLHRASETPAGPATARDASLESTGPASDGATPGASLEGLPPASRAGLQEEIRNSRDTAIVRAARRVSRAVVSINTVRTDVDMTRRMGLREYILHGPQREAGLGSGFIVDHRGYVLTAQHVIAGSEALYITLADGQRFAAELVGSSQRFDLAVVKIQGEVRNLPTLSFGDSDSLRSGEWVLAVGSPFGYLVENSQPSVTVGVVSALHRDVRPQSGQHTYYDMIQTDAAINPGNSGGPLVNAEGEVVGVNTSVISSASGGWTGLGFAVPIDRARWVMEEILQYGRVRSYTLGLTGYFLSDEYKGLAYPGESPPSGWVVATVVQGSSADRAGILPRDVITHVDGAAVGDSYERTRSLYDVRVGDEMRFQIWRHGKILEKMVVAEEDPDG